MGESVVQTKIKGTKGECMVSKASTYSSEEEGQ